MTRKRNRFWGSFWGETGRNTGKWLSNKIFGAGWSTPYSIENRSRKSIDIDKASEKSEKGNTYEVLKGISANTLEEICAALDETFMLLKSNVNSNNYSSSSLKFRIRSGIKSLQILGFTNYADFYRTEYTKYMIHSWIKKSFSIILAVVSIFLLLLIAKGKIRF